jgi:hypothetical protein
MQRLAAIDVVTGLRYQWIISNLNHYLNIRKVINNQKQNHLARIIIGIIID